MATRVTEIVIDDLDGSPAAETVRLALDGHDYEIDLSAENAARLRQKLAKFVDAATPVRNPRRRTRSKPVAGGPANKEQSAAVRAWAAANGFHISPRGRIPRNVLEAFTDAH